MKAAMRMWMRWAVVTPRSELEAHVPKSSPVMMPRSDGASITPAGSDLMYLSAVKNDVMKTDCMPRHAVSIIHWFRV
jgi:hypothetical protein